jgi:hypothetical protein
MSLLSTDFIAPSLGILGSIVALTIILSINVAIRMTKRYQDPDLVRELVYTPKTIFWFCSWMLNIFCLSIALLVGTTNKIVIFMMFCHFALNLVLFIFAIGWLIKSGLEPDRYIEFKFRKFLDAFLEN